MNKVQKRNVEVSIITNTEQMFESIINIWSASKGGLTKDEKNNPSILVEKILALNIPIAEMIDITFLIKNVSISWREQAVRHRIGTKCGDQVGVDIVPNLVDSSFWSESMRIKNMGEFADDRFYRVPESIDDSTLLEDYIDHMKATQTMYNRLVNAGVPIEDAREVIPLGAMHDIVWKLNLQSLRYICGKRTCWVLQAGLWMPVISGMIKAIGNKLGDLWIENLKPPCFKKGKFTECIYKYENERRLSGEDCLPVCPMYLISNYQDWKETDKPIEHCAYKLHEEIGGNKFIISIKDFIDDYNRRLMLYKNIWLNDMVDLMDVD